MAASLDSNTPTHAPGASTELEPRELPVAGWLDGVWNQALRALVDALKAPEAWFPGLFFPGFVLLLPELGRNAPPLALDRQNGGPIWSWDYQQDRVWWLLDGNSWGGQALLALTILCAAQAGMVFARKQAGPEPQLPDLGDVLDLQRSEWGPALPLLIARAVLSTGLILVWMGLIMFLDYETQLPDELIGLPFVLVGGFSAIYILLFDAATQLGLQSLAVHQRGPVSALRHGVRLLRATPGRASRWIVSQALLLFGMPLAGYQLGQLTGLTWIVQLVFVGLTGAALALLWARAFTDLGGRQRDGSLTMPTSKRGGPGRA